MSLITYWFRTHRLNFIISTTAVKKDTNVRRIRIDDDFARFQHNVALATLRKFSTDLTEIIDYFSRLWSLVSDKTYLHWLLQWKSILSLFVFLLYHSNSYLIIHRLIELLINFWDDIRLPIVNQLPLVCVQRITFQHWFPLRVSHWNSVSFGVN